MKILLVEPPSNETTMLVQALHKRTGACLYHAPSLAEGLQRIINAQGTIDVALCFSESPAAILGFTQHVSVESAVALIRPPKLIALVPSTIAIPDFAKLKMHLPTLLRDQLEQICLDVAALLWTMRTGGDGPSLRLEHRNGHYGMFLPGATADVEIQGSRKIQILARILAGGLQSYPLEEVADRLEICRQSVKKYMLELRRAYDAARIKAGINEPGTSVVWMRRGSGGTVCGLRVRVSWG
jgi:hypothetical protein